MNHYLFLLFLLGVVNCAQVFSQEYPNRPVRIIVPWTPGGGVDITARLISPKLSEGLGQPIIIDNRPGASGTIGTTSVARSIPDGYTILFGAAGPNSIMPILNPKTPYTNKDFEEIVHFANTFYVLVVNPNLGVNSIQQLINLAKSKPGEITIGSAGNATPAHISGELLKYVSGINLNSVFYKGASNAVIDTMSGHISMTIETITPVLPYLKNNKLKALGITGLRRAKQIPDIPTIAESGFPNFEVVNWYGILTPAKTQRVIINKLNKEITNLINNPEINDRLVGLGLEVFASTPEDFTQFRKIDTEKWNKIIKDTKIIYE